MSKLTLVRVGTGTKLHRRITDVATYCGDRGKRRSRSVIVDVKHATEKNLCTHCFPGGLAQVERIIANEAAEVQA